MFVYSDALNVFSIFDSFVRFPLKSLLQERFVFGNQTILARSSGV